MAARIYKQPILGDDGKPTGETQDRIRHWVPIIITPEQHAEMVAVAKYHGKSINDLLHDAALAGPHYADLHAAWDAAGRPMPTVAQNGAMPDPEAAKAKAQAALERQQARLTKAQEAADKAKARAEAAAAKAAALANPTATPADPKAQAAAAAKATRGSAKVETNLAVEDDDEE